MSRDVLYHSAVQAEIREILDYYEGIFGRLADDFWEELTNAFEYARTHRSANKGPTPIMSDSNRVFEWLGNAGTVPYWLIPLNLVWSAEGAEVDLNHFRKVAATLGR